MAKVTQENNPDITGVYLDGELMTDVVSADVEKGEVVQYVRDENDQFKHTGGILDTRTRHGNVQITRRGGVGVDQTR